MPVGKGRGATHGFGPCFLAVNSHVTAVTRTVRECDENHLSTCVNHEVGQRRPTFDGRRVICNRLHIVYH